VFEGWFEDARESKGEEEKKKKKKKKKRNYIGQDGPTSGSNYIPCSTYTLAVRVCWFLYLYLYLYFLYAQCT
jgi:hypothetical protein